MKFVEEYLKIHHIKTHPHKFSIAVLLSPIHAAECHYKKHYHMNFAHARKLFLFDMILFMSAIVIAVTGVSWRLYDPTITDLVYISVKPSHERLVSGTTSDYSIHYENESDVALENPRIILTLPRGLDILSYANTDVLFDAENNIFTLQTIPAHSSGTIQFSAQFFATPHIENTIHARLVYNQHDTERIEEKTSPSIIVLRDSIIRMSINMLDTALKTDSIPLVIFIENDGDTAIDAVSIPLDLENFISLKDIHPQIGRLDDNLWYIPTLLPHQKVQLTATLAINASLQTKQIKLSFTPRIAINGEHIDQNTHTQTITILHPHIRVETQWDTDTSNAHSTRVLTLRLINDSDIAMNSVRITMPANAYTHARTFTIPKLPAHSTQEIRGDVYINNTQTNGVDIFTTFPLEIQARIDTVSNKYFYEQTNTIPLAIGSAVSLSSELRYYTAEGDQLGRGPLPPHIGEETKYWAFVTIANTTSRIQDLHWQATLPSYIRWTGKSSVSHGDDITYNESTRTVYWKYLNLNPHSHVGIYLELAFTPTATQYGTSPILLENISLSATDSFIHTDIYRTQPPLDISIPFDTIGKMKGVIVQ